MEAPEEFAGCDDHHHRHDPSTPQKTVIKRKRAKRHRSLSSRNYAHGAVTSSSSSGVGIGSGTGDSQGGGGEDQDQDQDFVSTSSQTISGGDIDDQIIQEDRSTEEEEDMANCLILLAQGDRRRARRSCDDDQRQNSSRRFNEMAVTTAAKAGFYVYECKTCHRSFPSFQALGGHRASHKKPRVSAMGEEKKVSSIVMATDHEPEQEAKLNRSTPSPSTSPNKSLQSNNKAKIHECSICGLEFTSGQALGGHMRRHRAAAATSSAQVISINIDHSSAAMDTEIKQRNVLELDLNLPAPEDDLRETKFQFGSSTQQSIVFSTPTLVDCHY